MSSYIFFNSLQNRVSGILLAWADDSDMLPLDKAIPYDSKREMRGSLFASMKKTLERHHHDHLNQWLGGAKTAGASAGTNSDMLPVFEPQPRAAFFMSSHSSGTARRATTPLEVTAATGTIFKTHLYRWFCFAVIGALAGVLSF